MIVANTDDSLFVMVGKEGGFATHPAPRDMERNEDGDDNGRGTGGDVEVDGQGGMFRDKDSDATDTEPSESSKTTFAHSVHPADRVSIPVVMVTARSQVRAIHRLSLLS